MEEEEVEEVGMVGGCRGEAPRFLFRLLARGALATSPRVKPAFVACGVIVHYLNHNNHTAG